MLLNLLVILYLFDYIDVFVIFRIYFPLNIRDLVRYLWGQKPYADC